MKAEEIVREEIAKTQIEIAAEAEAERQRRIAQGEQTRFWLDTKPKRKVSSRFSKQGHRLPRSGRQREWRRQSSGTLLMVEKVDAMVQAQVEAVKNLKIDKITVWDSGNGADGKGPHPTS